MKTASSSFGRVLSYIFYLALAFVLLCLWRPVSAQSMRPLSIGDTLPDAVISKVKYGPSNSIRLSDYRGKLLIIDFWATWCAPCVMMIPRIDSLQKQFAGKAEFLSVTAEPASKVASFLEKYHKRYGKRIQIPTVVSDTVLHRLFPHSSVPHYIWVDRSGIVRAVTEFDQITAANIEAFLAKGLVEMAEKKDAARIPYTAERPLLTGDNGGDASSMLYHSVLTRYIPGVILGSSWKIDSVTGRRITLTNADRFWLYSTAYGKPGGWFHENNVRIVSRDSARITSSTHGQAYLDWLADGNGFCYEIIVPAGMAHRTNEIMQQQLRDFFPEFEAKVITEKKQCLALVGRGSGKSLSSAGGKPSLEVTRTGWKARNVSMHRLVERVNVLGIFKLSVVNESGVSGKIDLDLDSGFSDLATVNRHLAPYGLALIEKQLDQQILIIDDNPHFVKR